MKSKILKMGISLVTASVLFSGCGSAVLPPKQIPITKQSEEKVLLVKATDLAGKEISQYTVLDKIGSQFSNGSKYRQKIKLRNCPSCTMYQVIGVESRYANQQLQLSYVNGLDYNPGIYESKDIFKFPIKANFDSTTNTYKITIGYPNEVTTNSATNIIGKEIQQLDTLQNLEKDAKDLFDNLKNQKILLKLNIAGEINTQYSDASTYANFERTLGIYQWGYREKPTNGDIAKEKYFTFKLKDGTTTPLHIKVYPYQNGSKVIYDLQIEYSLDMNGGMNLTASDIDNIKTQIAKIANN